MKWTTLSLFVLVLMLSSCGKYVTPGSSVNISELADQDIAKVLSNKPAAEFPVNIAIARVQSPTYTSNTYRGSESPKQSTYSMVLTRDAGEDEALRRLSELDGVNHASPFNRLLLPYQYSSIKDLRMAAARMKAQMLLVYTFDTEFIIDTKNYGPQNVIALGYLKNKDVKVVTTASVAIFDVQTEYLYGLAETTVQENRKSNAWKKKDEVDNLRLQTEREAFAKLMGEVENLWGEVKKEYAKSE